MLWDHRVINKPSVDVGEGFRNGAFLISLTVGGQTPTSVHSRCLQTHRNAVRTTSVHGSARPAVPRSSVRHQLERYTTSSPHSSADRKWSFCPSLKQTASGQTSSRLLDKVQQNCQGRLQAASPALKHTTPRRSRGHSVVLISFPEDTLFFIFQQKQLE